MLLLQAGDDKVVPQGQAAKLQQVCKDSHMTSKHEIVIGALHHQAAQKSPGRKAVVDFLLIFAK